MAGARRPAGSALARVLAGLLALASLPAVGIGIAVAWLTIVVSAQRPDPSVPNGDPCCGHPDTWGEVVAGLAIGAGVVAVCVAVLYLGLLLGELALTGARPRIRHRRRLLASLLTVLATSAVYASPILG